MVRSLFISSKVKHKKRETAYTLIKAEPTLTEIILYSGKLIQCFGKVESRLKIVLILKENTKLFGEQIQFFLQVVEIINILNEHICDENISRLHHHYNRCLVAV